MAPSYYTTAGNEAPLGTMTYSTSSWATSNADNTIWLSNDSRSLNRKPRAVVMHQPAWSARRWKSLT